MAEKFDPYHRWLGIAPSEQPPNYYRLLGVQIFEDDPDVIATAADRQMLHLRSFQSGPHSALSQRLLNEVAAARVCLLNPRRRAEYDAQLRGSQAVPAEATAMAVETDHELLPQATAVETDHEPLPDVVDEIASLRVRDVRRKQRAQVGTTIGVVAAGAFVVVLVWAIPALRSRPKGGTVADARPKAASVADPAPQPHAKKPDAAPEASPSRSDPAAQASAAKEVKIKSDRPRPKFIPAEASQVEPEKNVGDGLEQPVGGDPERMELPADPQLPEPDFEAEPSQTKVPVPDDAAQAAARKRIDEAYRADVQRARTPVEKHALARKLLSDAGTARDAATRYVLWRLARETANDSGDWQTAFDVADAMAKVHPVAAMPLKCETMVRFSKLAYAPEQVNALVEQSRQLAEAALTEGDYRLAERMCDLALAAARKFRSPSLAQPILALGRRIKEQAAKDAEKGASVP